MSARGEGNNTLLPSTRKTTVPGDWTDRNDSWQMFKTLSVLTLGKCGKIACTESKRLAKMDAACESQALRPAC